MELCKTRMQLQGELLSASSRALSAPPGSAAPQPPTRLYTSAVDCFAKTLKGEGIRGVQRGLGAAYIYQILLNGSRLGFYEPFRKAINRAAGRRPEEVWTAGAFAAGATSGVVGGEYYAGMAICGKPCD